MLARHIFLERMANSSLHISLLDRMSHVAVILLRPFLIPLSSRNEKSRGFPLFLRHIQDNPLVACGFLNYPFPLREMKCQDRWQNRKSCEEAEQALLCCYKPPENKLELCSFYSPTWRKYVLPSQLNKPALKLGCKIFEASNIFMRL